MTSSIEDHYKSVDSENGDLGFLKVRGRKKFGNKRDREEGSSDEGHNRVRKPRVQDSFSMENGPMVMQESEPGKGQSNQNL